MQKPNHQKTVIPLVVCAFVVCGLFFVDRQIWIHVRDVLPEQVRDFAYIFTYYGLYLFYLAFAVLLLVGIVRHNRRLRLICGYYLLAQAIFSVGVVRGLKIILGRARPYYRPETGSEFTFFSLENGFHSFPSGHAADAFLSGVLLYYLIKKTRYGALRWLPLIYAAAIAACRVLMNAHYPSDVLAGAVIGTCGAWFVIVRLPENRGNDPQVGRRA